MTDTVLQLKAAIEEVHKHLPGRHDQLSHAGDIRRDVKSVRDDAKAAAKLTEESLKILGWKNGKEINTNPKRAAELQVEFEKAVENADRFYRGIDETFSSRLIKTGRLTGPADVSMSLDPEASSVFGDVILVIDAKKVRTGTYRAAKYFDRVTGKKTRIGFEEQEILAPFVPKEFIIGVMGSGGTSDTVRLAEKIAESLGVPFFGKVLKHLPGQHNQKAHGGHDLSAINETEFADLRMEHLVAALDAQRAVSSAHVRLSGARQLMGNVTGPASHARAMQEVAEAEKILDDAEKAFRQARMDLMDLPVYLKHLPGKHDQKDHGVEGSPRVENYGKNVKVTVDKAEVDQTLGRLFRGRDVPSIGEIAKAYVGGLDRLPKGTVLKLKLEARGYATDEPNLDIEGVLLHDGKRIGHFDRSMSRYKGKSGVEVYHESLYMNKDYQGTGYGSEMFYHSEHAYRMMGVDAIRTFANDKVGGYAWAKMGFEFDPSANENGKAIAIDIVGEVQEIFDEYVHKNKLAGDRPKWIDERLEFDDKEKAIADKMSAKIRKRVESMKYPYQFAAFTVKSPGGIKRRVGKEAMLRNEWAAVKYLNRPPSPAVKAGNRYRRRRRKILQGHKKATT